MTNSLKTISQRIISSPTLQGMLGVNLNKYVLNVITEISKTRGDKNGDLTLCTPESIVESIKKAVDLKLEIDGRQHCHLIKYGSKATLQIGYRGLVYSIKRAFPDANIDAQLVYAGDEFTLEKQGDRTTYFLKRNNIFAKKEEIIGGFCYISYTINGKEVSFCETMSIEEIQKVKGVAKQHSVWNAWFEEKAKVALIKRACKIHFAGINEVQEVIEYDNQESELKEKIVEAEIVEDVINQEQALELEELAKKAGLANQQVCDSYKIESLLQFPLSKFEKAKELLKAKEVKDANN